MTERKNTIVFIEQGVIFMTGSDDYNSYSIYHTDRQQTIIVRYSSEQDQFNTVVLNGLINYRQFLNQYLPMVLSTFTTNAFPSEEAAVEFSKLLLAS